MTLSLTTNRDGSRVVVAAVGDLDVATAPDLWRNLEELTQEPGADITIDVRGVDFVDSTGLGSLVRLAKEARRNGGGVSLSGPSEHVRKLLAITALDQVLPVID